MKISKKLLNKYNSPETLVVVSSYSVRGGEVALENAVSRYSKLLIGNFPKEKKVIVFCESRKKSDRVYELDGHILIVPVYVKGSILMGVGLVRASLKFCLIRDYLIQFEFSVYGGKKSLIGILGYLLFLKLMFKNTNFMFHQVLTDISKLSGHLGISKNSVKTKILNEMLRNFYILVGILNQKVIVHDKFLKDSLTGFVGWNKIEVINHGVDEGSEITDFEKASLKKEFGFSKDGFVVLVFGYKSWYKGTDWVVENLGEICRKNSHRNIKILLAGGDSPTLGGTKAYKQYKRQLDKKLEEYSDVVTETGFVPENEVGEVFGASDLVVFPYRVKMSASGALSLAFRYGIPVLVSKEFSKNLRERDVRELFDELNLNINAITFSMNKESLEGKLKCVMEDREIRRKLVEIGRSLVESRSWKNSAMKYLEVCSSGEDEYVLALDEEVD